MSKISVLSPADWWSSRRRWLAAALAAVFFVGVSGWKAWTAWRFAVEWRHRSAAVRYENNRRICLNIARDLYVRVMDCAVGIPVYIAAAALCISRARRAARRALQAEGRCVWCRYDLRGLTEPRCPECGTVFDPSCELDLLPSPTDGPSDEERAGPGAGDGARAPRDGPRSGHAGPGAGRLLAMAVFAAAALVGVRYAGLEVIERATRLAVPTSSGRLYAALAGCAISGYGLFRVLRKPTQGRVWDVVSAGLLALALISYVVGWTWSTAWE